MGGRGEGTGGRWGVAATAAALLLLASLFHFFAGRAADPDLWQHVRDGRGILAHGTVPGPDAFSYTAAGRPVIDHEWLAQAALAVAFDRLGAAGLLILKLALGAVILAGMLDAARTMREDVLGEAPAEPLAAALVLVLAMAVISPGMMFRPQLFTFALLALQSAFLARADRRLHAPPHGPGPRIGAALLVQPLLIAAWANLHGGFLAGVAAAGLFALVAASRAVRRGLDDRLRTTPPEAALLLAVGIAVAAAPLANPYGAGLLDFLRGTLGMHGPMGEWAPTPMLSPNFARFDALLALAAAATLALWWSRAALPRVRVALDWRAPLLGLAAFEAVRHQRHTVLFAILAAPVAVVGVEAMRREVLRRRPDARPRPAVAAAIAVGVVAVAAVQGFGVVRGFAERGIDVAFPRAEFPVDAMAFLRHHRIAGNVAVPFEWGSYAIWKLPAGSRVFIDGRYETVYPESVIREAFAFQDGADDWQRLLDDHPTDVVVVQRVRGLQARMMARDDFEYVYSDPASFVFVRRNERMRPVLEALRGAADRAAFPVEPAVFP